MQPQEIQLNLIPSGVYPIVYLSQYDVNRPFIIDLYYGTEAFEIQSKDILTLRGMKPDHHAFVYSTEDGDSQLTVDKNQITVMSTEQMTAIPRKSICEIVVVRDKDRIATLNFVLDVEPAPVPSDEIASASDLYAFQHMADSIIDSYQYMKETRVYVGNVKDHVDEVKDHVDKRCDAINASINHIQDATLLASKWTGTEAPYTYDLANIGDFGEKVATVIMNPEKMTMDHMLAARDAQIIGSRSTILYALREKPTIDIPVIIGWTGIVIDNKET